MIKKKILGKLRNIPNDTIYELEENLTRKTNISNHLENRDLYNDNDANSIFSCLSGYEKEFSNFINSKNYITYQELNENNNIYDLIQSKCDIPKRILEKIARLNNPSSRNITRGIYEILIELFSNVRKNNIPCNGKNGDINFKNYTIEIKQSGARIAGQGTLDTAQKIDNRFIELCKYHKINDKELIKSGQQIFKSKKNINKFNELLCKYISNNLYNYDKIIEILSDSLLAQFDKVRSKEFVEFKNFIKSKNLINHNNEIDLNIIKNIFGVIDMYFYQKYENWDSMIIFYGRNSEEIIKNGNYVVIDKSDCISFENLYNKMYNELKITHDKYPGYSTRYREWSLDLLKLE